jgi:uncharacterized protein YqeY
VLRERLNEDMRTALKAREAGKARLSVLRVALAAVKNREIELRRELTDEEIVDVLAREVRARQDVLPDYERGGRPDLVGKMRDEIAWLQEYLPSQVTPEEIEAAVRSQIAATGATGMRDIGKVMGPVMQALRGRADGRLVQETAKRLLGG